MLSAPLDILRIRQYFNAITFLREVAAGVRADAGLVDSMRHALLPLPFERNGTPERHPFGRPARAARPAVGGRISVVASGGSGALASLVGVARALEELGLSASTYSMSSGAALFGFPLAAGLSADEVAEFTLDLRASDLVDVDWTAVARLGPTAARGFTGLLRGDGVERAYRRRLGTMTLERLAVPAYAVVWNVDRNRVEYIGPRTHPRMTVAHAVRMAVALPLFMQAVRMSGHRYYDGGSIDILPVAPLLDIESPPDVAIALNCFHPHEFGGNDVTGWTERAGSILYAAEQVRTGQHMELARRSLARLRKEVPEVLLLEPVPYAMVAGTGLYRQFVDNRRWPEFMRAGRSCALGALRDAGRTRRPVRGSARGSLDRLVPARPLSHRDGISVSGPPRLSGTVRGAHLAVPS